MPRFSAQLPTAPALDFRHALAVARERRQSHLHQRALHRNHRLHQCQQGGPKQQRQFRFHGIPPEEKD